MTAEAPSTTDISQFVIENGRMPAFGDEVAPWHYRGWLLMQIQHGHFHPEVVNRWGYYLRTLEAGRLLDEPIPQIQFNSVFAGAKHSTEATKMLQACIDIIFHDTGSWSAFPAFIDWLAWGCAVSKEEPHLSEKTNEALYRKFNFGPMLLAPSDYLGWLYSEGKGRWNPTAFFPTPHEVCHMMALMNMHDIASDAGAGRLLPDGRDSRTMTVCDPCVGSGRMLMHASNYSFCLYGMDIDHTCCKITQINGALYVPWMSFPFSAEILGRVPAPPLIEETQPVPVAVQTVPVEVQIEHWIDDRGQGLLFGSELPPVRRKQK